MEEWRRDVFHVQFPPRRSGYGVSKTPSAAAPSTAASIPTAPSPSHHYSPQRVSDDDALNFLGNPHTMIGKQFVHSRPQDQPEEDNGTWEVTSYTVKKADGGGVVHEYQVLLQAFGADPVLMDEGEVRHLLRDSTLMV